MAVFSWLSSSFVRHFPRTEVRCSDRLTIDAALNERFSFQVVMRMDNPIPQKVCVEVDGSGEMSIRVRRIGYVPVLHRNILEESDMVDLDGFDHIPGYVGDPLFDDDSIILPPQETNAFWITVQPGRMITPSNHEIRVTVIPENGRSKTHTVQVRLHDIILKKRKNFSITNWFYNDCLIDWYKTDMYDKRFWEILPAYFRNISEHGQDTIYTPVFTPPLDGVKRPSQLLRVLKTEKDKYSFDWRDVRKYIQLAKKCGLEQFEWTHPFTQWGVENAIRIYQGQGHEGKLLWNPSTGATSKRYRTFLSQYLPSLHRFLTAEKILDKSFFHVSDEPYRDHLENYNKAREILKGFAPWMKVMDALSNIGFARQGLTDMPIPSTSVALDFLAEGIESWCYYCCHPRGEYINRLIDTPLAKIAMHGFLFYRWPFRGFLHWGLNYWNKSQSNDLIDPFTVQDGLKWPDWSYGDTFQIYPGPKGPIDSIRWEIFGQSLQDYQLLQTLGIDRNHKILTPVRSFADFPKTEIWRRNTRKKLLDMRC